ncbi:MAG: ATP-dependent helicase, partial [Geminicoccales bacterium]
GDLLLLCLELFLKNPDVLADYQRLYHYILVDEYQDTNVAQYLWLRLLAKGRRNICCVGDDDQSIYGWRGAEVGNILRFEKDFPGARIIRLEQNYRSTPHILAAASGLIACNEGRLGKTLWTDCTEGEPIEVRGVWDGVEEARVIGDEIEALQRKGHKLSEIAILVRAGFQTREFEERFITLHLPYRVIGGPRFYEREEIRDAVAYLRVIHQQDDDLALERIINKPARGVGQASLQAVHTLARAKGVPLYIAAIKLVQSDELRPAARRSLGAILNDFERWRGLAQSVSYVELAKIVLDESGYTAMWQNSKKLEAPGKLENLKELVTALADFENLAGFLEHISLVMENLESPTEDMVNLMTLHSAKGLEFDTVFLPGWEEALFPHQRSLDENGVAGLEEERRLAYVGLTRARQRVKISFAANRRIHNQWQSA